MMECYQESYLWEEVIIEYEINQRLIIRDNLTFPCILWYVKVYKMRT